MTTGAKIAVGCGVALILGIIVFAVAVGGAAYWAKGKVEGFTGEQNRIEELHKKASAAAPFETPADGVIREDRLVKFIEIRKRVFSVYEKHRAALDAMSAKKQGDLGDVTTGFTILNEIRLAQAQAEADVGMGEEEYRFLVEQVYKTAWAAEVFKSTGKTPSEAASEVFTKAQEAMKQAQTEAARARQTTRQTGQDAAHQQAKDAEKSIEEGQRELGRAGEEAREGAAAMDVPPANIALFKKYEADLKKYAMGGLEWIGL